jgi:hypothetical protein
MPSLLTGPSSPLKTAFWIAITTLPAVLTGVIFLPVQAEPYPPKVVQITQDPENYSMGWAHAFSVQDPSTKEWTFLPLMGETHSPATNNSIRIYNPAKDKWTYWQRDLHHQLSKKEWFAGQQTTPPSASGRDNFAGFYLPWEGKSGQLWIASPGRVASNHGIFDIAQKRWVRLVQNQNRTDFAPIRYSNKLAKNFVNGWNFADAACENRKTLVRYGGKQEGILVIVEKKGEGYVATGYHNQPPGPRNQVRNSGICVDGQFFLFGGNKTYRGEPLSEVWRLDLGNREWQRMPPTPYPIPPLAQVTYDPDIQGAVILFNKGNRFGTYDLKTGGFQNLTEELDLPVAEGVVGAFVPGAGHFYRGGAWGNGNWRTSNLVYCVSLAPSQQCGQ